MEYCVYLDESGDLGWKLNKQYRKGGSSTFFTIAYVIVPKTKVKLISRFIKKFHSKRGGKIKEVKGASIALGQAKGLARRIVKELIDRNPDIKIGSITLNKKTTPKPLVATKNDSVLYDYMVIKAIAEEVAEYQCINVIPDKRSVPSGSQNSCSDLLKSELWINQFSMVSIEYSPEESHNLDGLMFIDWVANFVWRHYEDGISEPYLQLKPKIKEIDIF